MESSLCTLWELEFGSVLLDAVREFGVVFETREEKLGQQNRNCSTFSFNLLF